MFAYSVLRRHENLHRKMILFFIPNRRGLKPSAGEPVIMALSEKSVTNFILIFLSFGLTQVTNTTFAPHIKQRCFSTNAAKSKDEAQLGGINMARVSCGIQCTGAVLFAFNLSLCLLGLTVMGFGI